MIDTNTVNYAMSKLSATWQKAMPFLQNISEKYIHFIITKTILSWIIASCVLSIGLTFFIISIKCLKDSDKYNEDFWTPVVIISAGIVICSGVAFFITGFDAILAITNSEMFVIDQIISNIK